jgi:hypothetical protein
MQLNNFISEDFERVAFKDRIFLEENFIQLIKSDFSYPESEDSPRIIIEEGKQKEDEKTVWSEILPF